MGRAVWIAGAWLLSAPAAAGEAVSTAPDAVSVTIYRNSTGDTLEITNPDTEAEGLAMVTETRTFDLPAGRSRLSFRGVAEGMVPQTAKLVGLPSGVVEQNFDYDLLSPSSLLAKSVGKTVKLVRTNSQTGEVIEKAALIRSGPDGVVMEIDGRVEGLDCAGWAERLVFDEIPQGLWDRPTLSLVADVSAAGRYQVKLSYLARGFDWSTDYVARINPGGKSLDLTGWITLVNKSAADFSKAPVAVVAGKLNRVDRYEDRYEQPREVRQPEARCWWAGSTGYPRWDFPQPPRAREPDRESYDSYTDVSELVVTGSRIDPRQLGDYKLYAVPEPTRIAPHQVKQVRMLEQTNVRFDRLYYYEVGEYKSGEGDEAARVELRLKNDKASNLGLPLPAGFVAVMEDDGRGGAVLAGDDRIEDQAVGLAFEVELGGAPDVRATATTISRETRGRNETWRERIAYEVTVLNGKPIPVDFEVRHRRQYRSFEVTSESRRHQVRFGSPYWRLRLAPGERAVLRYAVEQG